MIPDLTLISFYTPNWEYPTHAERLRAEAGRLGLPAYVEKYPDGGYLWNTLIKPRFIRHALDILMSPVLWLDVDGSVLQDPRPLLRPGVDFMPVPNKMGCPRKWKVGALYFANTGGARAVLNAWIRTTEQDKRSEEGTDDWALELTRRHSWPEDVRMQELPEDFCSVLGQGQEPPAGAVTVIRLSSSPDKKRWHRDVRSQRGW